MDGRTDIERPTLLGRLRGVDLINDCTHYVNLQKRISPKALKLVQAYTTTLINLSCMWLLQKRRHDIVSQRAFNRWRHTRYSGTAADGTTNWLGWAEGRFVAWISALTADVAVAVVNRRSTSTIQPDHTFSFTANYVWSHARWSPPRQQACRYAFVCLHISLQASASASCCQYWPTAFYRWSYAIDIKLRTSPVLLYLYQIDSRLPSRSLTNIF